MPIIKYHLVEHSLHHWIIRNSKVVSHLQHIVVLISKHKTERECIIYYMI